MRFALGAVLAVASVLLIAWLALHWLILPHIQQWREPLEHSATRALGVPVRIGRIELRSSGWVPSIELHDVAVLDADRQPALRLPRVYAALSPRSLFSLELRFEQLLIDGAELEVRRDRSGRILVAGIALGGSAPDTAQGTEAADWFFSQGEFVIRAGALRWTDEQRGAAPLALTDVQLVVRNGLRHHDLRIDATPPPDWGERFTAVARFTQPLLAHRGDWKRWSGTAYANLPRADLQSLRQHVTLPFELREGDGALRGWFDVKNGELAGATVDLALRAVTLRLAAEVEPLAIEEVQGRLTGARRDDGYALAVQRFGFRTADDILWPAGDMRLTWFQRDGAAPTGGEFSAQRLDIALMAQIASRVPVGEPVRKLLADLKPQGIVTALDARWDGALDAPTHYKATATLAGVSLAALPAPEPGSPGRPGLHNAGLQIDATEAGGQARLTISGGGVDLPGVFEDPRLELDQLSAQLLWKIEPASGPAGASRISVQVKEGRFSNPDASGEITATWRTGASAGGRNGRDGREGRDGRDGRYPGHLELDAKLSRGQAARVYRYLPLGIDEGSRHYVQQSIQSGRLASASFRVRGDLADFPFYARGAKDGEFHIDAKVEDARFAFVPGQAPTAALPPKTPLWPAIDKVGVELVLDRNTLEFRGGHAQLGNVQFRSVQGAIRGLGNDAQLGLDIVAAGPLAEMLRFVAETPVGGWTGHALDATTAGGVAELRLGLGLPLAHLDASTVKGSLTLVGNDVRVVPGSPLLAAAKGRVDFSHKGFAVVGATAKVYGGDASFDGGQQADGTLRFNGQGTVTADGLRQASELGQLTRVAGALSGQAAYRLALGFVHGEAEVNVTSSLTGLAINLPAPLNKPADMPLALRYQTGLEPASGVPGALPRDTMRLELGNVVQAIYLRELAPDHARVLRGGIGVMEPAPQPATGVAASVNLKSLATDEWEAAIDRLGVVPEPREGGARNAMPVPAAADAGYLPGSIALRVQELVAGPRRLTHLSAGLSQDAGLWRANLDADQLNGYIEYRPPSRRGPAATVGGRVFARLSRLSLPKSEVEQVESLLDQQPTSLPALDVVVDDFELRGKKLGRIEIEAINRLDGQGRDAVRDWQLSKFDITLPEARLTATGSWAATPGPLRGAGAGAPRRSTMDFKLAVSDSGALLDRLGTPGAIRRGKGQLSGQIGWDGSPFSLDIASLGGQVNVAIDAGQFLKADPGAARLLGVLSLQSLPRRLSLDFRDVFQEGFAFDSITGDVKIAQGVAETHNLRMRGVQAAALLDGSADIAHESQDLRVVVVPEITAGTAALAYAVINPAIGLGAFLAQALLKKPLSEAGTREFRITGSWADPKVERVEHRGGDDVTGEPAAAAAASAPAKNR